MASIGLDRFYYNTVYHVYVSSCGDVPTLRNSAALISLDGNVMLALLYETLSLRSSSIKNLPFASSCSHNLPPIYPITLRS